MRPVDEVELLTIDMNAHRPLWTICEVLREIYKIAMNEGNSEIALKAREATVMAKRMDRKLREYKKDYDDGWWREKN